MYVIICLAVFIIFFAPAKSVAQDYTLPIYYLTIDPAYIDNLNANPASQQTYPAELQHDSIAYPCEVRYRGATSLNLPKKSWKIYFDDTSPQGWSETNFNAEYRDYSLGRNHLSMELTRFLNRPAPDSRHISFIVNDDYMGVFLEVEQVNEEFYDSRGLGSGSTFKCVNHGARFAPPMFWEDLTCFYEVKTTPAGALDTLGARLSFIQYTDSLACSEGLPQIIDISNFIDYFAVQFAIGGWDGMTKNYYIHNRTDNRYMLVPWDCDATFGNNWQGNYIGMESNLIYPLLDHQAVFQRLISHQPDRTELLNRIELIADSGFQYLTIRVEEVYDEISHDVHLDDNKRGTNEQFDDELSVLQDFIYDRASALQNLDWFHRVEITESIVHPDYISSIDDTIRFQVTVEQPVHSIQTRVIDANGVMTYLNLNDEGISGDSLAGDLIYTLDIALSSLTTPIYYGFLVKENPAEGYPIPFGGWSIFNNFKLSLPVIRLDDTPPQPGDIEIVDFNYELLSGVHYFGLRNSAAEELNLSGCVVHIGSAHQLLRLQELESVLPGDTIFVTNNVDMITAVKPQSQVTGKLCFKPVPGDTINFETSSGTLLTSVIVDSCSQICELIGPIVINEINYNSAVNFDPEDWIEIYCRQGTIDLSGWILKDNSDVHQYLIPDGITIGSGEYLVIAEDTTAFRSMFPQVVPVIGGFDFGFNADGDEVRLFDEYGILIDCVIYDDEYPWPVEPDGSGSTLELIDHSQPNFCSENWLASTVVFPHGTPGSCNSVYHQSAADSLFINEFMADNTITIPDSQGQFDDWIEIWNGSNSPIDLNCLYLTDNFDIPYKWAFPDTNIQPGEFLLIWADDDEGDPGLHTNFKLSANGEEIGCIYDSSGFPVFIDSVQFGPQNQDVSSGRYPDGIGQWQTYLSPTPGLSNTTYIGQEIQDLVIYVEDDTILLTWSQLTDVSYYEVHRSNEPYFAPSMENLIATVTETLYMDEAVLITEQTACYRIIAVFE